MEICQSCSAKIEVFLAQERVTFTVVGGVTRSWVLCESCKGKLQDMVLGYMGELPPEQGSPESLWEPNGTGWVCHPIGDVNETEWTMTTYPDTGEDYTAWFDESQDEEPEWPHLGCIGDLLMGDKSQDKGAECGKCGISNEPTLECFKARGTVPVEELPFTEEPCHCGTVL